MNYLFSTSSHFIFQREFLNRPPPCICPYKMHFYTFLWSTINSIGQPLNIISGNSNIYQINIYQISYVTNSNILPPLPPLLHSHHLLSLLFLLSSFLSCQEVMEVLYNTEIADLVSTVNYYYNSVC